MMVVPRGVITNFALTLETKWSGMLVCNFVCHTVLPSMPCRESLTTVTILSKPTTF